MDEKRLIEEITRRVLASLQMESSAQDPARLPVGVSVRHVHISAGTLRSFTDRGISSLPCRIYTRKVSLLPRK